MCRTLPSNHLLFSVEITLILEDELYGLDKLNDFIQDCANEEATKSLIIQGEKERFISWPERLMVDCNSEVSKLILGELQLDNRSLRKKVNINNCNKLILREI